MRRFAAPLNPFGGFRACGCQPIAPASSTVLAVGASWPSTTGTANPSTRSQWASAPGRICRWAPSELVTRRWSSRSDVQRSPVATSASTSSAFPSAAVSGRGSALAHAPRLCSGATMYEAAGRDAGLLRLAEACHVRVMADEIVGHGFSHGFHPDHSRRPAAYLAEALGGPTLFLDSYGDETAVVRLHSGNGAHAEMDRRAIACFDQALDDVG